MTQAVAPKVAPRLHIFIFDESQRAAGEAFRAAVNGKSVNGQRLAALAPVVKPDRAVTSPQLRCTEAVGCSILGTVADLIAPVLGARPRLVDASRISPATNNDRANHFEVWFGPAGIPKTGTTTTTTTIAPAPEPTIAGGEGPAPALQQPDVSTGPCCSSIPRTLRVLISRPAKVVEGDIVSFAVALPADILPDYVVSIGGLPATLRRTAQGIDVTVPKVTCPWIGSCTAPVDIRVGGRWHIAPAPRLEFQTRLEQNLAWVIALSVFALSLASAFVFRRFIFASATRRGWLETTSTTAPVFEPSVSAALADGSGLHLAAPVAEPPQALVDACVHGEGLLFLGAELPGERSSPHTGALTQILDASAMTAPMKEKCRQLLREGDHDTVVDLLAERLGRRVLIEELARHYAEFTPPAAWTRILPHTGFSGAISSGFRRVVEAAWPKALRLTLDAKYDFSALVREKKPFVLQLRGDLDAPETVNLTNLELGRAIDQTRGLRSVLGGLFAARVTLFVGLDAASLSTALEMAGIRSAAGQKHYALVEDTRAFEITAERFARQYGIEFIRLGIGDDATAFLGRLANEVTSAQRRASADQSGGVTAPAERATISRLRLSNIGPFDELDLEFRRPWTVLLGNNGAGKSTILRAIALALSGDDSLVLDAGLSLLRRGATSGVIELTVTTGRSEITYRSILTMVQGRLAISANTAPLQSGTMAAFGFPAMRGAVTQGPVDFMRDDAFPHPRVADVVPIIAGGVDDRGRSLKQWIFRAYLRSMDSKLPGHAREKSRAMIDSLFRLLDSMTPGFHLSFSRCDPDKAEILLNTSDGEVPMDYISQGMSATIGWIGPVIQRLFEINGEDSRPEDQQAILLIDEIDSHLHPAWQQKLVDSLKQHFPNLQVIATTHSPLMVGNLGENEVLRVVRDDQGLKIEYLGRSFIGYRFDQILTDEAFGLERARSEKWTAREDYALLLGKSDRTPAEEAEFQRLEAEMRKLPGAAETPAEGRMAEQAERDLEEALRAAARRTDALKGDDEDSEGRAT